MMMLMMMMMIRRGRQLLVLGKNKNAPKHLANSPSPSQLGPMLGINSPSPSPSSVDYQVAQSSNNVGKTRNNYMLGALIIAILLCLILASLCLFFRRKIFPVFRRRWTRKGSLKAEKLLLRRFQLEELQKATKNFSEECLLGFGAFGNVYKGTFEAEGTLAIKKAHAASYQSTEEFRNEVRLLSKVNHRNLISLVGFCEENGPRGAKVLVYEYVPNGSLLEYIMGRSGRTLTWRERVNIAIGAAKGISHLHDGVNPSIIHRDLKPSNILIGEGFEAKVSDFGLVKMGPTGDQSHVSSQVKGTPGYLDPAYCSSLHLSPFSDVYSFGVILLQLVAARPAVDATKNHSRSHIIEWARSSLEKGNVEDILDANLLLEPCNMEMMLKMGQLGLRCVVPHPKSRPTMTQVWQELEDALHSANNFINKVPTRFFQLPTQCSNRTIDHETPRSAEYEHSQSFVSIDGVGFQRFRVEMDSVCFESTSLRYFENSNSSLSIDMNYLRGISEEKCKEDSI